MKCTSEPPSVIGAGVALVDAREDLHERRLAGAVLADEAVHLAGAKGEADAVQHGHAEERLLEALGHEDGLGVDDRGGRGGAHRFLCVGHATTSSQAPDAADASTASVTRTARSPSSNRGSPSGDAPPIAAYASATNALNASW